VKNIDGNNGITMSMSDAKSWDSPNGVDVLSYARGTMQVNRHKGFKIVEYQSNLHKARRIIDWNIVPSTARNGAIGGRHCTVGSYDKIVYGRAQPNYLHYIVLDIDNELVESHETAKRTLRTLGSFGCDLDKLVCAFTGNRGFHIHIPAGMLGNPVFNSERTPRSMLSALSMGVLDESFDAGLFSPFHMYRLSGSQHEGTGRYKIPFRGSEFLETRLEQIVDSSAAFRPIEVDNPSDVAVVPDLVTATRIAMADWKIKPKKEIKGFGFGNVIEVIERGIEEGEQWDLERGHVGRNKAMYVYACYCLKESDVNLTTSFAQMVAINERFSPPLSQKEMSNCLRSAMRTITKSR
jgi:hypothetical protein